MPVRVDVQPKLLRWARERARISEDELVKRFPRLREWEHKTERPTFKQLQEYARATRAPFRYFFLAEPPIEQVPIPDFRTVAGRRIEQPSPDLLDTIYLCQQRQEWYREFARAEHAPPLEFVGAATLESGIEVRAARIRHALHFDVEERGRMRTWVEALRAFIEQADALGVLVMVNGVVANNTHRRLDPEEFRGFALADPLAPVIFINGADTKAAQMFTLAHELAHIWLGQSALSDVEPVSAPVRDTEAWCNRVAAELLVPLAAFRREYRGGEELRGALDRLARQFKVSTLVVLRRVHDVGGLRRDQLREAYGAELDRFRAIPKTKGGGDFYLTQGARVGKRFARALVISSLEGRTLYRDAFHLLGFSKVATLRELGHSLGVI
jgi:Zn-dependent peptidase ImmA (M78 family)